MWLSLSNSFLSVVAAPKRPDDLMVRARVKGHIEAVFPGVRVYEGHGTDYQFRSYIPRKVVAKVIAKNLEKITYTNFKDSVKDAPLHNAYMSVWSAMFRLQTDKKMFGNHKAFNSKASKLASQFDMEEAESENARARRLSEEFWGTYEKNLTHEKNLPKK